MKASDLREELQMRVAEFEQALEQGASRVVLMDLYKKLKELQFQMAMARIDGERVHSEEPQLVARQE